MSNHLHLLAKADSQISLAEIVRDFKKFTSKELLNQVQTEPESRKEWILNYFEQRGANLKRVKNYKVWSDGYHAIEVSSNDVFWQKLNYIHNNPVEEMVVLKAEDYLFSSAVNYSGNMGLLDISIEQ